MNSKIKSLTNEIAIKFKSIYSKDITEFKNIKDSDNLGSLIKIDISSWNNKEIDLAIISILEGLKHYIENFVAYDKNKYRFPIVSYNSVLGYLENGDKELVVYIKKIPQFNHKWEELLKEKGYL